MLSTKGHRPMQDQHVTLDTQNMCSLCLGVVVFMLPTLGHGAGLKDKCPIYQFPNHDMS